MRREYLFAAILILAAPRVMDAAEKFPEPSGFGKAKFGMSVAQVRKLYPKLQPAKGTEQAASKGQQFVLAYGLENQSVGPLTGCRAQLRFFKDELYEVQFRCPDHDKVIDYFKKTYEEGPTVVGNSVYWMGQQGAVSLTPKSGVFAFSDVKRTQAMQSALLVGLGKRLPPQTPTATAPATTPTAAETPAATPHE